MADDGPTVPSAPPDAERLLALDDQVWGDVLVHLRRAVAGVAADEPDPRLRRLSSVPATRLMTGRTRRDAARAIAGGGPLWIDLRRRIGTDPALAARFAAALHAEPEPPSTDGPAPLAPSADATVELDRLRSRLRRMREQRDEARRRADGEAARADREAASRSKLEATVDALRGRVEALEDELARAGEDRTAAVDRERRRGQAAVAEVNEQLRALRRDLDDQARRDRAAAQARAAQAAQVAAAPPAATRRAPRLVPGRPSRLPRDVRADTTEAADLLLHDGRVVLVDGYNVTRTHRADLDLEGQRRWLVNLVAGAAASRRIDARVVFDGHASRGVGSSRRDRGVMVSFTPEGITADDDLVFAVEACDPAEPVVVVTDDRELRERLAPYRVDLLSTRTFLGAVG